MYADRLPPHDAQAEESVIGSVLIDGDSLHKVSSLIRPTDFYGEKNRWCYEAFLGLAERGEAINQVTVSHELALQERLDPLGGSAYLSHLVMVVPTSVHIEYYAGIVQRTSVMRQLIDAGGRIADIGYHESDSDTDLALSKAENTLFQIRSRRGSGAFLHIRNVLDTYMETNVAFTPASVGLSPVQTGFRRIDELLGNGMQRSDMIVVAARPSLGKSTLAFNIARAAAESGNRVGIFSLEMSRDQIALRLLASEAGVDSYRVRIGLLTSDEETRLLNAIGSLSDLPLYIDDTAIQTVADMGGKARQLQVGARPGPAHHRLPATDSRRWTHRQSGSGDGRDIAVDQGHGARLRHPDCCLLTAQPRDRAATEPSAAAVRPSREWKHRAGRGCGGIHPPRRRLCQP